MARWIGGSLLCVQFPRLFTLVENKNATVANLFSLGLMHGGEGWRWRCRLWAWEEELLEECRTLLFDVSVFPHVSDKWVWTPDPGGGYTVSGAYDLLTNGATPSMNTHLELDRLPMKTNLAIRGVIPTSASYCVSGCDHVETAEHIFLNCTTFASLWQHVREWIGFVGVDSDNISDHFLQFTLMTGPGKAKCSFLQLIWLMCIWVVWNERNNRLFNNVVTLVPCLLDKVKLLSLGWLKANNVMFVFGTHMWWSSSLTCLGID
ncbi:hypothetical protein MTR_7g102890 [Medicago truncatula]|uniref:Reverse transcriptase zinc-binding domain-containing protein n=1 Tax=Medicago truncatula TaxID=3880 RepID=A0A072U2V2_MEDTR|nr:hypothetical protein MTR_7g102890 [Medicago truncatula]